MLLSLTCFVTGRRHIMGAAGRVASDAPEAETMSPDEARHRVVTLLVMIAIVSVFWLAFYQNGFTLTLWARDNTVTGFAPETFQSVEPFGVIVFSFAFVFLWAWMGRRGIEPSTPVKIVIGIVFVALAFAVMAVAGLAGGDTGRVSMWWLVGAYLLVAVGEVCLSPMGLSLVNRVAPPRSRGVMMGAWFVGLSAGGYFSGSLGAYWNVMPHSRFFLLVVGILIAAAFVLGLLIPRMRAMLERADAVGM